MQYLTIAVPDELLEALLGKPAAADEQRDLSRAALESLLTDAYREQKISHAQLRRLLGFETPMEVDAFLKERGIELEYTAINERSKVPSPALAISDQSTGRDPRFR